MLLRAPHHAQPQTAKNLILAGVGEMTLVDDTPVAGAAPGNFLVDHDADRAMRQETIAPRCTVRHACSVWAVGPPFSLMTMAAYAPSPRPSDPFSSTAEASVATLSEMNPLVRPSAPIRRFALSPLRPRQLHLPGAQPPCLLPPRSSSH